MQKGKSTLQCSFMKDLVTIFFFFVSQILLDTTQMYLKYLSKNEMRNQNLFLVFPTLKILHQKNQILNDK
jgi:hypothetical protein